MTDISQNSWPIERSWGLVRPDAHRAAELDQRLGFGRRLIGPALVLIAWWASTRLGWVPPSVLPSPGAVVEGFERLWGQEGLAGHIGVSLGRALGGGSIGVIVGLTLGLIAGLSRLGEELYDSLLQMLRTVPFLALVPLFIVWFGIGEAPKLLLIALATAFPMYLNVYAGVRNVDAKVIEAMRTFGLSGSELIREVVIPLAMPAVLTGLRYALGISVLVLIAAEQINSQAGLGYLLNMAQLYQQVDVILICILIYALLGLAADLIVRVLEKLLLPWRPAVARR